MIHDFYSREVANPVHLTVDTGFTNGEASIKAYVSINLSLGDRQLAAQFHEIPVELQMAEAERIGCMFFKLAILDIHHIFCLSFNYFLKFVGFVSKNA